jgi:mRNA-degrading endonuclease RelE of RelBE toxin-antitoxin system
MELWFSDEFKKDLRKIRDEGVRLKIIKAFQKLATMPERGKPLQYDHKGERRLRVDPFRMLYRIKGDRIEVICFEHRGKAY